MNCRSNYTGKDSLIEKIGSPLPRHLNVSNILKKNIAKKVKTVHVHYRLAINMKPVATIFDPKKVVRNKQYYLTNLYSWENTEETFISRRSIISIIYLQGLS